MHVLRIAVHVGPVGSTVCKSETGVTSGSVNSHEVGLAWCRAYGFGV